MRWLALAVSLIASVILIIHTLIVMLLSPGASVPSVTGLPGNSFTVFTGVLLAASAILALLGGMMAFNRRRLGGFLLVVAAAICFFAHRDTRIYGALYLVGGILSFFVKRSSSYEEDYDEDDDDYDDDEDEEGGKEKQYGKYGRRGDEPSLKDETESFRGISYGARRRERASQRITPDDREEYSFGTEIEPESEKKIRVRSSKVCPACGASVGAEHKFCFICGGPLYTARTEDEVEAQDAETQTPDDSRPAPLTDSFGEVSLTDHIDDSDADDRIQDDYEDDGISEDEIFDDEISPETAASHKVFVKPQMDEQPVPRRPVRINPDNSYQEFSNYTRRRKRRHQSLPRRILGLLLLLLIVSGSAWFLLGLRRQPGPIPDLPPAVIEPVPEPEPTPEPEPSPITGELPVIQIASPTRGLVMGSNVNIRSDHSTSSSVVTRLNTDARAELLDTWQGTSGNLAGSWYRIRFGEREGWIYGQYFQPLDGRESTLPQGYTVDMLRTFGTDKTGMIDQVGQPTRRSETTLTWSGMVATFKNDGEIARLQITGSRHVLKNRVAVGTAEAELYRTLGYPSEFRSGQLRYIETPNHGMAIRMKDGKVQSITVGNL